MNYGREIDGVRALGRRRVILFHCGVRFTFSGGYVGVDVFVISGYLITGIMMNDIKRHIFHC